MARTYTTLLTHVIFSTKNRLPLIDDKLKPQLYAYIGGVVRDKGGVLCGVGGVEDHVHLLVGLPPAIPLAEVVGKLKAASSGWMKRHGVSFEWQNGYAAFSVSQSCKRDVLNYINRQVEHHQTKTFASEYVLFLTKHEITYDERYVFEG